MLVVWLTATHRVQLTLHFSQQMFGLVSEGEVSVADINDDSVVPECTKWQSNNAQSQDAETQTAKWKTDISNFMIYNCEKGRWWAARRFVGKVTWKPFPERLNTTHRDGTAFALLSVTKRNSKRLIFSGQSCGRGRLFIHISNKRLVCVQGRRHHRAQVSTHQAHQANT